ncbi:hypothetical protein KEM60_02937 [Austwickia sp. TVS 96-490-7B]|uniref:hypothetical protein n=1 Tax=Austwickia sp. TVS 96-490-7B TaxID=2830843 RepID=UPI001C56F315|nr:hypothetical protein [Austwickia sp. TVS 96-490-7B]MBW3086708.1 hypothetical protein [Austwickia sp. TVS 96-490-7B]
MRMGKIFKRVAAVAAVGVVGMTLTPMQANAHNLTQLEQKHIRRLIDQYGSKHYAGLALAFDREYIEEAKKTQPSSLFRTNSRCDLDYLCSHTRNRMNGFVVDAHKKFHQAATQFCADRIKTKHKNKVTFKEYSLSNKKNSIFIEKKGVTQTNNTQKEMQLMLKNADTFTKTNTIGWGVEASATIDAATVKAAFNHSFSNSVSSTVENWRTVKAAPGESFRLDKGYHELTADVTALFNAEKEPMCNGLKAHGTSVKMAYNVADIVNQVDSAGNVIRQAKPIDGGENPIKPKPGESPKPSDKPSDKPVEAPKPSDKPA